MQKETFTNLTSLSFLKNISQSQYDYLIAHTTTLHVPKNKMVYLAEDTADAIFFVVKGTVKLCSVTDTNDTLVKYIVSDGDVFGENIFNCDTRSECAETLSDCTLIKINAPAFKRLVQENIAIKNNLTEIVIKRIKELEERILAFVSLNAKERIVGYLKNTALVKGIKIGLEEILVNHGLSHKEIAYLTYTSRQTVARILNELKAENIIHFSDRKPNKILVRNIAALC